MDALSAVVYSFIAVGLLFFVVNWIRGWRK